MITLMDRIPILRYGLFLIAKETSQLNNVDLIDSSMRLLLISRVCNLIPVSLSIMSFAICVVRLLLLNSNYQVPSNLSCWKW